MSILKTFYSWLESNEVPPAPQHQLALSVRLGALTVGLLRFESEEWVFRYSDEFMRQSEIKPITDFPILDRVYRSRDLWPFFALRVPSLAQPAVKEFVEQASGAVDQGMLLERFGRRSIANPFELVPVAA